MNKAFEVAIIGGSYAGLSAAMALGRSLRNVIIIDSGKPCNRFTPHSHNFITHDGKKPSIIALEALNDVLKYPTVQYHQDEVTLASGSNNNFILATQKGLDIKAQKLIFATGIKDLLPQIEGFSECWGISAIHCPYCHGYEVRGQKTGILALSESVLDYVKLLLNWTPQLTVFTNGNELIEAQEIESLGVEVVQKPIRALSHKDGHLDAIQFEDSASEPINALYHHASFQQHCMLPTDLGCELTPSGHIAVNPFQQTSIDGIYAAGDCASPFRAVSLATASGTIAGSALNKELIEEGFLKYS